MAASAAFFLLLPHAGLAMPWLASTATSPPPLRSLLFPLACLSLEETLKKSARGRQRQAFGTQRPRQIKTLGA